MISLVSNIQFEKPFKDNKLKIALYSIYFIKTV